MGVCCSTEPPVRKQGVLYVAYKRNLKPFDIILFKGHDFVSDLVRLCEEKEIRRPRAGDFSHSGMVVTSDILDHPRVLPGKVYVWESTMSGRLTDGVTDIDGRSYLGVQLRDLDLVVPAYDAPNDTAIAHGSLLVAKRPYQLGLQGDPLISPYTKAKFTNFFNRVNGSLYDVNVYDLCASLYPSLRWCRSEVDAVVHSTNWMFCSELIAAAYREMNIVPSSVVPADVVPADFIPSANSPDSTLPIVLSTITYMTTPLHFGG